MMKVISHRENQRERRVQRLRDMLGHRVTVKFRDNLVRGVLEYRTEVGREGYYVELTQIPIFGIKRMHPSKLIELKYSLEGMQ